MSPNAPRPDDTFDVRARRIGGRILDGIEDTLTELAQPCVQRAAIEHIVKSQTAPLLCRQATCRRAKSCRRKPCKVPGFAASA